jgi:hypothetical protein
LLLTIARAFLNPSLSSSSGRSSNRHAMLLPVLVLLMGGVGVPLKGTCACC